MCTTLSSPGRRPTTGWRTRRARALCVAGALLVGSPAALLAQPAPPPGQSEGQPQTETGCIRVIKHESVVEGASVRVRGQITNACNYVLRNVRVQVEGLDKSGQSLGKGEDFVEPSVVGPQDVAQFNVPLPSQVEPATVSILTSFRRATGY